MSLSATRCPSALLGRRWLTVAKSQAWLPAAVASVCCCGVSTLLVCRRPCRAPGPSWRSRGPRAVSSLSWPWFCRLSRTSGGQAVVEGPLSSHSPGEAPPTFPPFPAAGAWEGPVPVAPSKPIVSLARILALVAEAARPAGTSLKHRDCRQQDVASPRGRRWPRFAHGGRPAAGTMPAGLGRGSLLVA